jgi:hypothetical protein
MPAVERNRLASRILQCVLPVLAVCSAAHAQARSFHAECEARLAQTNVSVHPESAPYVTSAALSIAELTQKEPPRQPRERTLGLTIAHYESTINFEQNGLRDSATGEYCMRPRFTVKLSYSPIEVYVGREIPRGSCAYAEVVRHEEKHVAAYVRQLRQAATAMEHAMRAYYGNVIFYGDADQLAAQLDYQVKQRWLPFAEEQLSAVDAVQQAIDSPEEYARNRAACNGEIARILRTVR